jgi:hypothetical protein
LSVNHTKSLSLDVIFRKKMGWFPDQIPQTESVCLSKGSIGMAYACGLESGVRCYVAQCGPQIVRIISVFLSAMAQIEDLTVLLFFHLIPAGLWHFLL